MLTEAIMLGFAAFLIFGSLWTILGDNDSSKQGKNYNFKQEQVEPPKILVWDRETVDIPNISYIHAQNFEALYFCTTTGVNPDLSLIRAALGHNKINHWEYRTDNKINLQIYLLFSLFHISEIYGTESSIHLFTNDNDLKKRFLIHANGYGFKKVILADGARL